MTRFGKTMAAAAALAGATMASGAAAQVTVNWADLTQTNNTSTASGTIAVGANQVGVTIAGSGFQFVQTNGGTNYWTEGNPAPYTGGIVDNAPPTSDIVALNRGGLKTITFSEAVSDVYLALVSWNGNAGTFDQPFEVISQGCGYWGCGTFTNVTPTSFTANGELHGVIRFTGTFSSVSFTDRDEGWHGIQVGIAGLAPPVQGVPEPATWAMMIAGFGMVGAAMRRRTGERAVA